MVLAITFGSALLAGASALALNKPVPPSDAHASSPTPQASRLQATPEPATMPDELAVMTFNIRFDNPADGKNAWPHRRDDVAKLIARERPDAAGLQEALSGQVEDLAERLADYDWYGVGRDDGKSKGEFSPIFYRRDRFEVLDKGTFWLSETPDKVGGKGWDAALPRIASWLRLKDKSSGQTLLLVNTHFDHRGRQARLESARLLRRKLPELAGEAPIVLIGDFNASPTSPPYEELTSTEAQDAAADAGDKESEKGDPEKAVAMFRDARQLVDQPAGPNTTFNGFDKPADGNRIDHIFVDARWTVLSYRVLDEKTADGRFYSDHFLVEAAMRITREGRD